MSFHPPSILVANPSKTFATIPLWISVTIPSTGHHDPFHEVTTSASSVNPSLHIMLPVHPSSVLYQHRQGTWHNEVSSGIISGIHCHTHTHTRILPTSHGQPRGVCGWDFKGVVYYVNTTLARQPDQVRFGNNSETGSWLESCWNFNKSAIYADDEGVVAFLLDA